MVVDVVGKLAVEIIEIMVELVVLRRKSVEKIQPASSSAQRVGKFILDDGSFKLSRSCRNIKRERLGKLLFVALLKADIRDRRQSSFVFRREKAVVKGDAFDGIAIECREFGVEMVEMINRHAVEKNEILVVGTAIDLEVTARSRTDHARQNVDLRKKIGAVERQHVRRRRLIQFRKTLTRFHHHLLEFKSDRIQ